MTTRPTSPSKPKHGVIRGALIVAALVVVMLAVRGYLTATSTPDSALATSGGFDIAAMVLTVLLVVAAVLVGKLLRRGK